MLTDSLIRNAKPKDKAYPLPKESGLYLIVNPTGKKWWRFTYSYGGKENTLSLGTYPLIPLNLARQRREAARRLVAEGIDPSAQRRADREIKTAIVANTFAAVVDRWETDEMVANSDQYRASVHLMLDRDVLPYMGGPLGAAYDRSAFLDERKARMQAWADYLDTLRERSNVVSLRAA